MTIVFRSKVDALFKVVTWITIAICAAVEIPVMTASGGRAWPVVFPVLLTVGPPLWLLRSTYYALSDTTLNIRSGPFRWNVPLKDVHAVTPSSSLWSSPALSLDRLRIDYGPGKSVMISPVDKEQFLRELETRRAAAGSIVSQV